MIDGLDSVNSRSRRTHGQDYTGPTRHWANGRTFPWTSVSRALSSAVQQILCQLSLLLDHFLLRRRSFALRIIHLPENIRRATRADSTAG